MNEAEIALGPQAYFARYLEHLTTQRKLALLTVESYRRDLDELHDFAQSLGPAYTLSAITHFHVRDFAANLHATGQNPRSIAR